MLKKKLYSSWALSLSDVCEYGHLPELFKTELHAAKIQLCTLMLLPTSLTFVHAPFPALNQHAPSLLDLKKKAAEPFNSEPHLPHKCRNDVAYCPAAHTHLKNRYSLSSNVCGSQARPYHWTFPFLKGLPMKLVRWIYSSQPAWHEAGAKESIRCFLLRLRCCCVSFRPSLPFNWHVLWRYGR